MATRKTTDSDFSDNERILRKYKLKCRSLEMEKLEKLKIKENFQILNVRSDHISKSLMKLKTEYELHRADLRKTLYNLKLDNDKQQILSRMKIKEFLEKRKNLEEYMKISPLKKELEELVDENNNLLEQWRKVTLLLDLTKKQYKEIMSFLLKTFKMKVCEFCDTALKLKAINH